MKRRITTPEAVAICAAIPEFVRHFDRLTGSRLAHVSTNKNAQRDLDRFVRFVDKCVTQRLGPFIETEGADHAR